MKVSIEISDDLIKEIVREVYSPTRIVAAIVIGLIGSLLSHFF